MGAGASFRSETESESQGATSMAPLIEIEQSITAVKERKYAADFKNGRQLSLPILQANSPEGSRARRPMKTQQSIKSMSLRHRSRRENSYRIQKELASSLVNLHKQNFAGDTLAPTLQGSHERIDSILSSLETVTNQFFVSGRDVIPEIDSFPVSTDSILKLQTPRAEVNVTSVQPTQKKNVFGLHSRRPPALKLSIQDDSDWIQVEDDDGGDFSMSPRKENPIPLAGKNGTNERSEQSYMFTKSGTIFVDGFLEGIGKEGIVGTERPSASSKRSPKLPMRDRLVLLCKLGHGASGVVYKALDLVDMRLVALKMISVFEHGKRRQMVRELSALFQVLRQKKFDLKKVQKGGKLKGVRSQFSLRSVSDELNLKNKMKMQIKVSDSTINNNINDNSSNNNNINNNNNNNNNNNGNKNSNIRILDYHSLETVKELDSEKTFSHSIDSSYCSTPSSSCDYGVKRLCSKGLNHNTSCNSNSNRIRIPSTSDDNDDDINEYGISILENHSNVQYDEDLDESKDSGDDDRNRNKTTGNKYNDEAEHSGLEKFFVKPASEFIVDFFDAFSNIDDGGVALMMEYMDGGSLQDIVDDGGCDDEITLANIAVQALIGLAFLHSCGQLHRDLKPGNFLISHTGDVKVADLGILCQLDERRAPSDRDNENDNDVDKDKEKDESKNPTVINQNSAVGGISTRRKSETQRPETSLRNQSQNQNDRGMDTAQMSDEESLSPVTPCFSADSPMPHTKTFVGTVTFMSPERIDGREYSYPSDVWAFGLSLMTLAKGSLPIDTQGGYWTILHCIRDEEPPSLPKNGKFSDEFRDFLSSCLQKDPKCRLTCNQLLLHPFLRKAVPEECGIGCHNNGSGRDDNPIARAEENIKESKEVESRGLFELHSILSALHLHFERIQLGISPKSGLQHNEQSSKHPFFYGLKTTKVEDFLQLFLLGKNDVDSDTDSDTDHDCGRNGSINGVREERRIDEEKEKDRDKNKNKNKDEFHGTEIDGEIENKSYKKDMTKISTSYRAHSTVSSTRLSNVMDNADGNKRLIMLAKQLHLSTDRIRMEIILFFENLDKEKPFNNRYGDAPRRFSRVETPRAAHSVRQECK